MIEEWEETRVQIIEELSIIKGFISEICEEKKAEFVLNLKEIINTITNRINILKAEFEYVKEKKFEADSEDELSNVEIIYSQDDKLGYIMQIRKKTTTFIIYLRSISLSTS